MSILSKKRTIDVEQLYREGQAYFSMEFRETPPFLKLFNRPFYPELFDSIPLDRAFKALVYLLESAESRMEPAKEAFEYFLNFSQRGRKQSTSFGPGPQNWPDKACYRISPGC